MAASGSSRSLLQQLPAQLHLPSTPTGADMTQNEQLPIAMDLLNIRADALATHYCQDNVLSQPTANVELERATLRGEFSSWYAESTSETWSNPAKAAFDEAVEILKNELSPAECDLIWIRNSNSMQDVQKVLLEVQLRYQIQSAKGKLRSLLASCSRRVVYYAPVFDTLSQHYPEYVSLAWGAFKFLFMVMINHEELLAEISRAIINIANVLPRTRLLHDLYRTKEMQNGIASVYAKIIEFVLETVKWYKQNKLKHALSAVINPFKLSFKGIVDEIAERSRRVDELASVAVKAETRDVHMKVDALCHENVFLKNEMFTMKTEFLRMQCQFQTMTQAMLVSQTLQQQVAIGQQSQNALLIEWQTENIRQALESTGSDYGNAAETLAFCRSMRNRRRLRTPTQLPGGELLKLKAWIRDERSSLLMAHGNGVKSSSLDFATDLLDAIVELKAPIIWALPSSFGFSPTLTDILQSLTLQGISLSTNSHNSELNFVTIQDIRTADSISQWLSILERSLTRINKLFIIIDMSMIEKAANSQHDRRVFGPIRFAEELQNILSARRSGWIKIVLASWTSGASEQFTPERSQGHLQILTDRGTLQERKFWNPRLRGIARRNLKTSVQNFRAALGLSAANLTRL
ncbi:hypothetical protein F4779DRAFT_126490 [Xylariaceae sp. FL0662B]|nr:hypothetical protein F4779DRAFT_126490 [Xylariaceae sp. FL0662B]